jgi:hypothetical protein
MWLIVLQANTGKVYLTYLKTQRQVRNYFHEIKSRDIDHIDGNEKFTLFEHFDVFNLVLFELPLRHSNIIFPR